MVQRSYALSLCSLWREFGVRYVPPAPTFASHASRSRCARRRHGGDAIGCFNDYDRGSLGFRCSGVTPKDARGGAALTEMVTVHDGDPKAKAAARALNPAVLVAMSAGSYGLRLAVDLPKPLPFNAAGSANDWILRIGGERACRPDIDATTGSSPSDLAPREAFEYS
jgi:hypothetical protein